MAEVAARPVRARSLDPFIAGVLATCRRRRLVLPSDRVLVALSGGADSTALVAAMAALREAGVVAAVMALHVDHGLRPGSSEDGDCAARTCESLSVPFTRARVVVPAGNVQSQARKVRYGALRDEAIRVGATRIATGHTRTDQAETVLLRLLRGSGSRGLSGIPPRRGRIIRPLIDRSRADVIAFLEASGLSWREDPSNASLRYARNRVRHELVPALSRIAPAAERALARTADLLRSDDRALSVRARRCAPGGEVERTRLLSEPLAIRRRVVRDLWRRAAGRRGELSAGHVEAVIQLLRRDQPWRVSLPGRVEARCRYGLLEVVAARAGEVEGAFHPLRIAGPGHYALEGRSATVSVRAERPDRVPWPLDLRTRQPGDRFRPDGGAGTKKLKGWLIDRKVPRERRDGILVVAAGSTVLALPELAVRAQGMGWNDAGLEVTIEEQDPRT